VWYRLKYRRYRYRTDTTGIGPIPIPSTGIGLSLDENVIINVKYFTNQLMDVLFDVKDKSKPHIYSKPKIQGGSTSLLGSH